MAKEQTEEFGWPAVPRNRSNIPSDTDSKTDVARVDFDDLWPRTSVVQKAQEYVRGILPQQTYNHSLRVYCYGKLGRLRSETLMYFEARLLRILPATDQEQKYGNARIDFT